MAIFKKLEPLINWVQDSLQESVNSNFPQSLKDPINYFLATPGKKIRPLLTLLSAEAVGGNVKDALSAAVGIELFHDFTLIHDDIMDHDDLRRGRSTIHKKWGEDSAILVGDMMIGLAFEKMLQSDAQYLPTILNLFNETLIKVCEGQALDKEFEARHDVSIDEYLDMISKKTAWLFKLSCQLGAILGGGSENQIETMQQFGKLVGIGFQVQDDLLDYIGKEEALGKKVGSDLKMHKKTYVTLHYAHKIETNQQLITRYPTEISQFETMDKLKSALFDLDVVSETQQFVDDYVQGALKLLDKVQPLEDENKIYQMVLNLQKRNY